MRRLTISLLAAMIACAVAAPAAAATVCVHYDAYCANGISLCNDVRNNKRVFLAWRPGSQLLTPVPPAVVLPPRPTKITSCEAVPKEPPKGYCEATICGPAVVTLHDSEVPFKDVSTAPAGSAVVPCGGRRNPCAQLPSVVVAPGFLEGDSGPAQQGPAAAGTASRATGASGVVVKSRSY